MSNINPASYVTDTTSFLKMRKLESLPDFLEQFADPKKLGEAPKEKGSPHTIIVTGAGLRAADTVRYGFFSLPYSSIMNAYEMQGRPKVPDQE